MLNQDEVLKPLSAGIIPAFEKDSALKDLIKLYRHVTGLSSEQNTLFLLGIEQLFNERPLSSEIKSFNDFFNYALLFDREKNGVNRFFDAALGLRSLGNMAKLDQINEDDGEESMRVKGSYEYSHTQIHYSILLDLFNYLLPEENSTIVDIGSGFGRVGLFLGLCFPKVNYLGYEIVAQRVECALKVTKQNNLNNIKFETENILDSGFVIPGADIYYLYDPLDKAGLELFSEKIKDKKNFKLVAIGGYDDFLIEFFDGLPWLDKTKSLNDDYFKTKLQIFTSK